ncbi:MAG: hypothetical protein WCS89_04650 [Candidatus Paceibacterota bacterium]|jgi:hypothetical protein
MEPNTNVNLPTPNQNQIESSKLLEGPVSLFISAWQLFKNNWKVIVPIVIAPTAVMYIGQIFAMTRNPLLILIAIIMILVAIVFYVPMQSAAIGAIHRLSTEPGVAIKFKDQYKFGFKYFWSVILLVIIQTLVFFGSAVFLVIPGIIVGVYVGMYLFTLVLENKKGLSALEESYSLVSGRWFETFGRILFLALVYIIGAIVLAGLAFIIQSLLSIQPKSTGEVVLGIILNLGLTTVLSPLALIYMYKLYSSLKVTRLPNVVTATFKKWLIAFMVIGVPVMVALIWALSTSPLS